MYSTLDTTHSTSWVSVSIIYTSVRTCTFALMQAAVATPILHVRVPTTYVYRLYMDIHIYIHTGQGLLSVLRESKNKSQL